MATGGLKTWQYGVLVFSCVGSMLSGASVVHQLLAPDLVSGVSSITIQVKGKATAAAAVSAGAILTFSIVLSRWGPVWYWWFVFYFTRTQQCSRVGCRPFLCVCVRLCVRVCLKHVENAGCCCCLPMLVDAVVMAKSASCSHTFTFVVRRWGIFVSCTFRYR